MTNQEFREEANKLFDKVEYINENSGFISAYLELHHLKDVNESFYSLTLRLDHYKTKDAFLYASQRTKNAVARITEMNQTLDDVIEGIKEVVR